MTMKLSKRLDPIPPGEILLEDFMKPLGISINQLARDLDVPPNRIGAIVNGTRSITADTALRLGAYFGVSPETWLGLQIDYDLRLIRQRDGDRIIRSVRTRPAA
jgi:addiction module HigA family antidote